MARTKANNDTTNYNSLLDLVQKVDAEAEVLSDSLTADIQEWIPTGSYILNACLSGDLLKGVPSGRVVTFSGVSGAGKSYLMNGIAREAQGLGYTPIIIDTENAIDNEFCKRIGLDTSKLIIKKCTTVAEMASFVIGICDNLEKMKPEDRYKVLFILDSLSNLASDAEVENTETSQIHKQDFTKNKALKAFFRVVTTKLGKLNIPMFVSTHVYASVGDFFPTNKISGGEGLKYASSIILMLSPSKLDGEDKENDNAAKNTKAEITKTGVRVSAKVEKSRFAIPTKVKFQIPFFKPINPYIGLEEYCSWDLVGIERGNIIVLKEYEKATIGNRKDIHPFEFNGETLYFQENKNARGMVVKHLGKQVSFKDFWTKEVFTDEIIKKLNDGIIKKTFELPSRESFNDISEYIEEVDEKNEESDLSNQEDED